MDHNTESTLRILILEDSELDVELLRAQLKKEFDFIDEVVYQKEQFLTSVLRFDPDVILSDYSMPQFNGLEALEILAKAEISKPFIIVTGAIDEETAVLCIKAGADDYLLKDRLTRLPEAIKHSILQHKNETEKANSLLALEESVRNFTTLGEAIPDYVLLLNKDGLVKYSNQKFVFKNLIELEQNIFPILPKSISKGIKKGMIEAFDNSKSTPFTISVLSEEDTQCFYRCKIHRIFKEGENAEFMVMLSDISDIEERKIDLELSHSRLRDLLNKLELIRDEEKKRISMEIHDQLGQELTANKLGLFYIKQQLSQDKVSSEEISSSISKVNELIGLSGDTIQTVRRIAHQLRPIILDDLGLVPALEWMVKKFNENTEISWSLNSDLTNLELDAKFTNAAFRIVQETITNVIRHAKANKCKISVFEEKEHFVIAVVDNGVGFEPDSVKTKGKLGLFGIEERVKPWRGKLTIDSSEDVGTKIIVRFPIDEIGQRI